ncbi:SPT3 Dosage dependent suppressor of Ty-induced promoter mutations-like protein [Fusarium torreyae]|uniref:SPT3 Dosage dependent suppressor of Ty-induced promoter mutations-like protein n=1 Tax=Fusarium torreyae TaxID=1237075 RepID=A0A9W8S0P4_9HYPO|nr:SPT3 Dosage dependent suppressor of Ty-induced promoter mutations-like protein [Fusarium torreyae]
MTPAPTGPGSPLIAGAAMSGGDFNDFSDDELGASNLFDFSNSPDTLQTLESLGGTDTKAFLSPQDLTRAPFPDSPNGSYQDSSSESASSKRTASSTSSKTAMNPVDVLMDDGEIKMEWGNPGFSAFGDDDATFAFGRDHTDSSIDGIYNFADHDDSFIDRTFDFESASSSPEAANGGGNSVTSPQMPMINSNSPNKDATPKRKKSQGHQKAPSQYSVSSAMNGLKTTGSREVSPMSNMVMSHDGSPAALFNSPSPHNPVDFSRVINGGLGAQHAWPNKIDVAAQSAPDVLPMHFGGQMGQPMSIPQQMSMATPFNFTGQYSLRIMPTPLKSRVETQIPIKMALSPVPPGVTKLHLPAHTISKPKLLAKPTPEKSPDMLELYVSLVCTSAMDGPGMRENALKRAASHPQGYLPPLDDDENSPQNGGDVRICQGCITRERKRAARKKIKKPDEEKLWSQDEERRVIVFNTQEVKEWQPISGVMGSEPNGAMQVDAPMRIACYCRHHGEKMGFNVIFTIKDYQDRVIAQAMSNPIMITDDHKTHPMAQLTAPQQPSIPEAPVSAPLAQPGIDASALLSTPNGGFRMSPSNGDLSSMHRSSQVSYQSTTSTKTTSTGAAGRALSRPASPTMGGPMAKKRKSSASRVPNGLTMTRLDTSPSPGAQANQMPNATSPFTPNLNAFSQAESLFGQQALAFATGPPTPSSNDQPGFFANNRSASMDNLAMAQLYSAPASGHPSRAPSPNGLRNGVANPQNQFAQALSSSLYTVPIGMGQTRAPPVIHKIIPNEGPKIGGIEVTVLGAAFFQGLEVWFGDQKATTTTFWGESSLVCLLPPSPVAGAVAVTFKHQTAQAAQTFPMGKQPPIFKYLDDNEDKLIRTALSVLGHKMSGQMVDVSDLARRILNDGNSTWSGGSGAGPSSGGQMFSHAPYAHLESQLLKCLDLIDLDDSTHRTRLDLKRSTGHTMLHLSCSLGYHRFVAALLARGANPDARDKGGFTPLHIAAIHNHPEIVRRLILNGADPTLRSVSGLAASDVAQSRAVLRAIRRSERHTRSRSSGGSLHSRASSATSLRSLWEPMTKVHTHDEPISQDSSEESPEYTSGDFEDEDPDENAYLSMRRPSGFRQDRERPNLRRQNTGELEEELAPPATAMAAASAALKDHFQQQLHQFQQSIAVQFQNLPHFPQMPQMPALPNMPDYQAPFMRRVQQLMPGMAGPRPENQGEQPQRWWDSSSKTTTPAPPAYEEIYPQEELDRKQASAAHAAVEAEADMKCSALYDQVTTTETESVEIIEVKTEEPGVLKIGRKNAITKEQQEQFRRAHEVKMKRISSDHNLFFIWIPLLLIMVCAMLYSYFPSLFTFAWAFVRSLYQNGLTKTQQLIQQNLPDRVVEV